MKIELLLREAPQRETLTEITLKTELLHKEQLHKEEIPSRDYSQNRSSSSGQMAHKEQKPNQREF
jgi:uncharacterized membrane-anchored protein YhcB (DUF1043 family)